MGLWDWEYSEPDFVYDYVGRWEHVPCAGPDADSVIVEATLVCGADEFGYGVQRHTLTCETCGVSESFSESVYLGLDTRY